MIGTVASVLLTRPGWEASATHFGGLEQLALADGSALQLNTDSEVHVRITTERRDVVLVRGEAHFEVAHDPRRVFEVKADDVVVQAVGTAFSVRVLDHGRVHVLVDAGRVSIARSDNGRAPLRMLSAGEAATIEPNRVAIEKLAPEDTKRKLAWIDGQIWLGGETLAEAVAEFNRYNHRRLIIAEPAIAGRRVGGSFDSHDIDSFAHALERSHKVRPVRIMTADRRPGDIRLFAADTKPRQ